jgi:hypothetical protein
MDRRGLLEFYSDLRHPHFCPTCLSTSFFNPQSNGSDILVCCGDARTKRAGCGREIKESEIKRWVGDCLKCKKVRRATHCLRTDKYLCLYCWDEVSDVTELSRA